MTNVVFYGVPGKKFYEEPKLVIRQIGGKTFYWNYNTHKWVRLTKRCPLL